MVPSSRARRASIGLPGGRHEVDRVPPYNLATVPVVYPRDIRNPIPGGTVLRFTLRPPQVDAIQLRVATWAEIRSVITVSDADIRTITAAEATDTCGDLGPDYIAFSALTVHRERVAFAHGDWIVFHSPNAFRRFTPADFAATYAPPA